MNRKNRFPFEDEGRLQALFKLLPVGIAILDKNRKPIYANLALGRILGLSDDELVEGKYSGRTYLRLDGSEMPDDEFPSTRVFNTGQAVENVEIGVVKESGEVVWTSVNAIHFERGDWQVVLTVSDTTQQKLVEQSLKLKTAELVERVKELRCIYGISALVEQPGISLEEILQGTVEIMPASWQHPAETRARISLDGREYASTQFATSQRNQRCDIYVHSQKSGYIEVFYLGNSDGDPFLAEEYDLLNAICERLGRIIERFRSEKMLVKLATTDPLTGLYNRRHFFELAGQEVFHAKRYRHPLACIMFDVDNFKEINDTYGHLFGDKVLNEMVQCCYNIVRKSDIFARYGGDEFVILLPESDDQSGRQLAERLWADFLCRSLQIDNEEVTITLSLGVASMPGNDHLALGILLNRADEALYKAKGKGRNQVASWLD